MQFTRNTSSSKRATNLILKLGLVLILFLGAIFLLTSFLMQSNSTYMFADQELDKEQLISPSDSLESKEEMDDMKQIDLLNNIDGSFVNDQEY